MTKFINSTNIYEVSIMCTAWESISKQRPKNMRALMWFIFCWGEGAEENNEDK